MSLIRARGSAPPLAGRTLALAAIALFSVLLLAVPSGASAKRGLITGIADDYVRQSTQDDLLDRTEEARAGLVRIAVDWRSIASTRPLTPRNPADPAYDFSALDSAVRGAQARGFEVLFTTLSAPDWAEGPNRPSKHKARPGTWDPDHAAFGNFGHALAERYSGSFVDRAKGGLGPLPRVRHFEVWNEPNLRSFLTPQWAGHDPRSPVIYRRLLSSFYDGVKAVDPDAVVIGGSTSSYGDPPGVDRMRPLVFLRNLFCLKGRRKLNPQPCPTVKLDALSLHPINTSGGPRGHAIHPDDVATGDVGKVKRVLRAAEKGGNVQPGGRRPLWATEFWWLSDPPGTASGQIAVPLRKQARWIAEALYLFWKKRLQTAIYYRMRDLTGAVPTGLVFADGTPKPAFSAFRFPFVTERRSKKRVQAWGKSPASGKLRIERRKGGKWRKLKRIGVSEGEVFARKLRLPNAALLRARVEEERSLAWRQRG